jgi:hypothetical protein
MLQSPTGATIAAMMETAGRQQHSGRGFLAGGIDRRLKLNLAVGLDDPRLRLLRSHQRKRQIGRDATSQQSRFAGGSPVGVAAVRGCSRRHA